MKNQNWEVLRQVLCQAVMVDVMLFGQGRTGGQSVRFLENNAKCNARLALKGLNIRVKAANY